MSTEQNKAHVRRLYDEAFTAGRLETVDELVAVDAVDHQVIPGIAPGAEGLKQAITMMRTAFPDLRAEVEDLVAEGDRVASRTTLRGTHLGPFQGIPATGRSVEISCMDIIRLADGLCVEHWGVTDDLGLMQQLGVIPAPGAQAEAADAATVASTFYDAFNARDFDRSLRHTDAGLEITNVPTGETFYGPEGFRRFLEGWVDAFPDARVEVTNLIAAGDRAVVEFIARGTHTAPLQTPSGEVPPTGRPIEVPFCDVWEMRGGKAVRGRAYFDLSTMLRQLGLLDTPAESVAASA